MSIIISIRRSLRGVNWLRRLYYRARDLVEGPVDPVTLRLVPQEAFRAKIRALLALMIARNGQEAIGDYVEFGVFNGATLATVYEEFHRAGLTRPRFFGFDSFEGLPASADSEGKGLWMAGQCACSLETATVLLDSRGVDWSKVHLVKGWFSDTLTPARQQQICRASLIMVDSDLYSSAAEALRFIEPLIGNEAVIIFDDWFAFQAAEQNLGEKKAFDEFMAQHHGIFESVPLGGYDQNSMIVRVTRI
jgi:hypothetical protein